MRTDGGLADGPHPVRFSGLSVALGALFAALFLAAGAAIATLLDDDQWAPLGPYPDQAVCPVKPTIDGCDDDTTVRWFSPDEGTTILIPAVPVDAAGVFVTGTKCVREPAVVSGQVKWTSEDPGGFSKALDPGSGPRAEGCVTRTFLNETPPEVQAWARRNAGADGYAVVRIGACETPSRDEGTGATLCWTTEPFALVVS